MKRFIPTFLVGLAGVVVGSLLLPFLFNKNYLDSNTGLGAFIAPQTVINRIEEKVTLSTREALFARALDAGYKSIVAVESFSGGKLVRYGSGLILTQDGLVLTLNSIVPTSADFYQVFVGGKIDKSRVVSRDYQNNLALVELTEKGTVPINFSSKELSLGTELIILGRSVNLAGVNNFSLPAFVFQKTANQDKILVEYEETTYGGIIFDQDGKVVGILDWLANKPKIISSSVIQKFFNDYALSQN